MTAPQPGPYAFHLHPVGLAVPVLLLGGAAIAHLRLRRRHGTGLEHRQWWALAGAAVVLAAALGWPLADLAAHWSLTALVVQRLLLVLGVAPLLIVAAPAPVRSAVTRPPALDAVARLAARPFFAVVFFSAVSFATLLTPAVALQARSAAARGVVDAPVLVGGFVLWAPVLRFGPAAGRPGPLGRAVYLMVQSIVPGFPSVIFVFSRHPFYPAFAHAHLAVGLSPLADQQLAGVVAKVATLPVLWVMAGRALGQALRADREDVDVEPLTWDDVQRDLERVARAERRVPRPATGTDA